MSPLAPTDTVVFKTTAAGLDLAVDVFSPAGDALSPPAPLIIWYHVGALLYGDRKAWFPDWLARGAKERRWTVVSADYRLVPEASIDEVLSDVKDLWRSVQDGGLSDKLRQLDRPTVDLAACFVAGGSAGGYLTLQAGHLCSPPPKALVPLYGYGFADPAWFASPHTADTQMLGMSISDASVKKAEIERILEGKGPQLAGVPLKGGLEPRELLYYHVIGKGTYFSTVFGRDSISPDPACAYLWPQRSITPAYPPTFLVHGAADSAIPASESVLIARKLAEHGVRHELRIVDGAEHLLDHDDGSAEVRAIRGEIWAFLERSLE